jgi:hypothetical protein
MQVSAELRWFWRGAVPDQIEAWFRSGPPPAGGEARENVYLRDPARTDLGIKERGQKPGVEIKGLVAVLAPIAAGPFAGGVELWCKWSSEVMRLRDLAVAALVLAILSYRRFFDQRIAGLSSRSVRSSIERPLRSTPHAGVDRFSCAAWSGRAPPLRGSPRWWMLQIGVQPGVDRLPFAGWPRAAARGLAAARRGLTPSSLWRSGPRRGAPRRRGPAPLLR